MTGTIAIWHQGEKNIPTNCTFCFEKFVNLKKLSYVCVMKDYEYNYPEQVEMAKRLSRGDFKQISVMAGVSKSMVSMVFTGKRRINEDIHQAYTYIIALKKI